MTAIPTDGAAPATGGGGPGPRVAAGDGADAPACAAADGAPVSPVTWTGGQHALVRIAAGVAGILLVADGAARAALSPSAGAAAREAGLVALTVAGVLLSVLVLRGRRERLAAPLLAGVALGWSVLLERAPSPGDGALLLALLLLAWQPAAPVLGVDARRRVDPGQWEHRREAWTAAWLGLSALSLGAAVLALQPLVSGGGAGAGSLGLDDALQRTLALDGTALGRALAGAPEAVLAALAGAVLLADLAFVPLALARRTRGLAWTVLLVRWLAAALLVGAAAGGIGPVLLLLLAFDPGWVPRKEARGHATIFYDGHCGLCHATVRLLLGEDAGGELFRFAPLQGATFAASVPADVRARLPDSLVLRTPCGDLLLRSDAVGNALLRLGGAWRLVGAALLRLPRPVRDGGYDLLARVRKRLFGAPQETCPLLPPRLRERMLD